MTTLVLCLLLTASVSAGGILNTPICMGLGESLKATLNGIKRIVLEGQMAGDNPDTWLNINLVDGGDAVCVNPYKRHSTCNMLLHFKPRTGKTEIVRNTWVLNDTSICINSCKTEWGTEETHGGLPLKIMKPFQIIMYCETNAFQIYIDGTYFASYAYRIPVERATHLVIVGSGSFTNIEIGSPEWPHGSISTSSGCGSTINHYYN